MLQHRGQFLDEKIGHFFCMKDIVLYWCLEDTLTALLPPMTHGGTYFLLPQMSVQFLSAIEPETFIFWCKKNLHYYEEIEQKPPHVILASSFHTSFSTGPLFLGESVEDLKKKEKKSYQGLLLWN